MRELLLSFISLAIMGYEALYHAIQIRNRMHNFLGRYLNFSLVFYILGTF